MTHILFLTQVLPFPLDSGPKVRQYYMLRYLSKNHLVTLVSFVRPDDTPEALDHLRTICQAVHAVPMRRSLWRNLRAAERGLLTGLPIAIARDDVREMETTLQRLTQETNFDVIHADQLSMAGYGQLAAKLSLPHQPRTLLDEHNAIYMLVRRMAATEVKPAHRLIAEREARAFARYERDMCRTYDALLTVTQQDREFLLDLFPRAERPELAEKITPLPICVDPEEVAPIRHQNGNTPTILHLGTMFWPPNVSGVLWFAREVLPLIHQRQADTQFVVVGKKPPSEVRHLAADPRINVTGYVADPLRHLERADAFVVPLLAGGGMRVKILDAWLRGLPIISTPIGAEGIESSDGENILIAEDAPAFAEATLRLLTDPELNEKLRVQGRAWAESMYAWQTIYRKVDEVYDRFLGAPQRQFT
jgi:glycosyltransferase involved in cell wall biosynthesis